MTSEFTREVRSLVKDITKEMEALPKPSPIRKAKDRKDLHARLYSLEAKLVSAKRLADEKVEETNMILQHGQSS